MRITRTRLAISMACALTVAYATPALAIRYASPAGTTAAPCTLDAPCTLAKAIGGATPADKVVRLLGGNYPALTSVVAAPAYQTEIGAQPGTGRPVIHLGTGSQLRVINASSISDVDVVTDVATISEPLFLADGATLGERLRVMGSSVGPMVKTGGIGTPATLRDSLVVNDGTGVSSSAIAIECNGCSTHAQLSHVTAISHTAPALRATADASGSSVATLDVANSIVLSTSAAVPDLRPDATGGSGADAAWINMTQSAFGVVAPGSPREHVVVAGAHLTAAPLFADAASGDYGEASGSPTIDAGAVSALDVAGERDLLGMQRTIGSATDMGAFEAPAAPIVGGAEATDIGVSGATLHGTVTPEGHAAGWHFEIGTTTAYGTVVGAGTTNGAAFEPESADAIATSLQPGTTYHYRLVATHAYGTGAGEDRTFTTSPAPPHGGDGPAPPPAAGTFGGVRFASLTARLRRGAIKPRLVCPADSGGACTGTIALRERTGRKRIVAKARFTIAPGHTAAVRVALAARVRRVLRRARSPRLNATVSASAAGIGATTRAVVRIRVR